jgi:hypothetical protein
MSRLRLGMLMGCAALTLLLGGLARASLAKKVFCKGDGDCIAVGQCYSTCSLNIFTCVTGVCTATQTYNCCTKLPGTECNTRGGVAVCDPAPPPPPPNPLACLPTKDVEGG